MRSRAAASRSAKDRALADLTALPAGARRPPPAINPSDPAAAVAPKPFSVPASESYRYQRMQVTLIP